MNKKTDWNKRFANSQYLFGNTLNDLLLSQRARLKPGMRALSIGDGEGFNSIWLAQQGLDVTSLDISTVAQQKAKANATAANVMLDYVCADITNYSLDENTYDLVLLFFVHLPASQKEQLANKIYSTLKHNGLLILECFHKDHTALNSVGPKDVDLMYSEEELDRLYPGLNNVFLCKNSSTIYEETQGQQPGCTVQYVGLKP